MLLLRIQDTQLLLELYVHGRKVTYAICEKKLALILFMLIVEWEMEYLVLGAHDRADRLAT